MKKLVDKRPDIAFYLKLFTVVSPDPQTSKSIICAKSLSMLEDAYEHKPVPKQECTATDLDDNTRFAQGNGITGAPALVFPDGTIQMGYSEAAQLEKRIDEAAGGKEKITEKDKAAQ
jgi:thiol:disulfide interchange protein DsbC